MRNTVVGIRVLVYSLMQDAKCTRIGICIRTYLQYEIRITKAKLTAMLMRPELFCCIRFVLSGVRRTARIRALAVA